MSHENVLFSISFQENFQLLQTKKTFLLGEMNYYLQTFDCKQGCVPSAHTAVGNRGQQHTTKWSEFGTSFKVWCQCLLTYQRKLWMIFGVQCKDIKCHTSDGGEVQYQATCCIQWLLQRPATVIITYAFDVALHFTQINLYLSFLFLLEMES